MNPYVRLSVRALTALSVIVAVTAVGAVPVAAAPAVAPTAVPAVAPDVAPAAAAAPESVTVSATRMTAPGGRAGTHDTIVCVVSVTNPGNGGSGRVKAAGLAVCTGMVDTIMLGVGIYRSGVLASSDRLWLNNAYVNGFEISAGCLTASYNAVAVMDIIFPSGYWPPYGTAVAWSDTNNINCGAPPNPPGPGQPPFGQLEIAENTGQDGNIHVSGWAINPSSTAPVMIVLYYRNGNAGYVLAGTVLANEPRPDIAAAYPQFGPNHGFDANANEGEINILPPEDWPWGYPGEFEICAYAGVTELGCGTVTVFG